MMFLMVIFSIFLNIVFCFVVDLVHDVEPIFPPP